MRAARTVLVQHPEVFNTEKEEEGNKAEARNGVPGLLGVVVSLVASAVSDKRSVVQTNGLRCMAELFRYVFAAWS